MQTQQAPMMRRWGCMRSKTASQTCVGFIHASSGKIDSQACADSVDEPLLLVFLIQEHSPLRVQETILS